MELLKKKVSSVDKEQNINHQLVNKPNSEIYSRRVSAMTPKENTSLVWPISLVMVNLSACNQSKLSVIQTNQSQSL